MKLLSISFVLLAMTSSVSTVHGKKNSNLRSLKSIVLPEVVGFELYDPSNGKLKAMPGTLDLNDYEYGKINIVANVDDPSRMIECVKLSFAGDETMEKNKPYSLYGDNRGAFDGHLESPKKTGKQTLEAFAYSDPECSSEPLGHRSMEVDVIPTESQGSCDAIKFYLVKPNNNDELEDMPGTLDLNDYEDGKINIMAFVYDPCHTLVNCVKLSFAGDEATEKNLPYALYGNNNRGGFDGHFESPKKTGKQTLEAFAYTDPDCSGESLGHQSMEVDVIPTKSHGTCDIVGFDLYDPSFNELEDMPGTLDLNYYKDGEINIVANVNDRCDHSVKCVKLSFAGDEATEKNKPYSLYGDNRGAFEGYVGSPKKFGKQTLEAFAYSDLYCSGEPLGHGSMEVNIISNGAQMPGKIEATPFIVVYESTKGPARDEETNAAAERTCSYIESTFGYGMIYRTDISMKSDDFSCTHTAVDGNPLKIYFEISAAFEKHNILYSYGNYRDLPTEGQVDLYISQVVNLEWTCGPFCDDMLKDFLSGIPDNSPYAAVTSTYLE